MWGRFTFAVNGSEEDWTFFRLCYPQPQLTVKIDLRLWWRLGLDNLAHSWQNKKELTKKYQISVSDVVVEMRQNEYLKVSALQKTFTGYQDGVY